MTIKRKRSGAPRQASYAPVTWAQMVRDVINTAINRGQLPAGGLIAILSLLVWKTPNEDVGKLLMEFLDALKSGALLGYAISVILACGWFFHARIMRRLYSNEYARIGTEKSMLQSNVAKTAYPSSDKP